jgi:hypothetical protein
MNASPILDAGEQVLDPNALAVEHPVVGMFGAGWDA